MKISVIIPTLNEEQTIGFLVQHLQENFTGVSEIIVADGGSTDQTIDIAEKKGAKIVQVSRPGRGTQMNAGARRAREPILYFLHADTYPPPNFDNILQSAVKSGVDSGCFRLQFDADHPLLSLYAWFTRFKVDAFRFGDQSLFVTQSVFKQVGGFDERMKLMEDFDIIKRLKKDHTFRLFEQAVVTSARRYKKNGIIKLQLIFILIFTLYQLGASQKLLCKLYTFFIKG